MPHDALIGLVGTILSCLTGGWVSWWLWTVEERYLRADIPWSPAEPVDSDEYPIDPPYNDWIGLV